MTFKVKFSDEITAASEEEAYDVLLRYLYECVKYEDVTAFDFKKASPKKKGIGPIALAQTMDSLK
jgi:hypothetical protein